MRGPFPNLVEPSRKRLRRPPVESVDDFQPGPIAPLFPCCIAEALSVFAKIRAHPRPRHGATEWRARGLSRASTRPMTRTISIFDETTRPRGCGRSTRESRSTSGNPDTGTYTLGRTRVHHRGTPAPPGTRSGSSVPRSLVGHDLGQRPGTLPCCDTRASRGETSPAPRLADRITGADSAETVLVHQAPYTCSGRRGDAWDEAYLLGVLSSMPLRLVRPPDRRESRHYFHVLTASRARRPRDDPLRRRVEELAGRLAAR